MSTASIRARLAALAATFLAATAATAGSFGVSPIRVDLDRGTRTGLVTVTNDDTRKLSFRMKLFEWTQDEQGADRNAESSDLIFFPQIMTVEPGDKRVIRIGTRAGEAGREKAYRLFIEELQDPGTAGAQGAQVAVLLRFGVPVFVAPPSGKPEPEFARASLAKGKVEVGILNKGARTVRFDELTVKSGGEVIGRGAGWYVFPGATRAFEIAVPRDKCKPSGPLDITASAEGLEIKHTVESGPALCEP